MLDEVYACLRQTGTSSGCNVMLYRDLATAGQVGVAVGVEVSGPFSTSGRVVASALPACLAAMTIHSGPYSQLETAHRAVRRWCAGHGHQLTARRWEVYGDWHSDPAQLQTWICYELRADG